MTQDVARQVAALCCGEPSLSQLAGERAWEAGTGDVITVDDVRAGWASAVGEAELHVDRILNRLPPRELEFVEAISALTPADRTLSAIAEALGMTHATQVGTVSRRLDQQRGIIQRGGGRGRLYAFRHRAVEAYLTTDWPHVTEGG